MADSPSVLNHTIALNIGKTSPYREGLADEVLYPGMFVQIRPDAGYLVMPDGTVSSIRPPTIVMENGYHGKTIDDPYEIGSRVMMRIPRRGDIVLTKVTSITGADLTTGMLLNNDGTGWLRQWDPVGDFGPPIGIFVDASLSSPTLPVWAAVLIS